MKIQVRRKPPLRYLLKQKELFLSESEAESFSAIPETKAHDYLAGRFVLKSLFISTLDDTVDLANVSISTRDKKPQINFKNRIYYCSISHSKKYVACSINESNEAGIDIEDLKCRSEELRKYIVGNKESFYFKIDEQFLETRVWSIKEAAYKSDTNQQLITNYAICHANNDLFSVQNLQTGKIIRAAGDWESKQKRTVLTTRL